MDIQSQVRYEKKKSYYEHYKYIFGVADLIDELEITDNINLNKIVEKVQPDAIINCIGIIKQCKDANDENLCNRINIHFFASGREGGKIHFIFYLIFILRSTILE